jgi:hypothetical protein
MTITNGYLTLAEYKAYKGITSLDGVDDTVIENAIEAASRYIDGRTNRTFYSRSATNKYDTPDGDELIFPDDDCLSITTLTNGDGTVITSAQYVLLPYNKTPKFSIKLLGSSGVYWQSTDDGDIEQAITVAGTWGYSATAPDDIKEACYQIANNFMGRRFGTNNSSETVTTASGLIITARDVPAAANDILMRYKRLF